MGHENVAITSETYGHWSTEMGRARRVSDLLGQLRNQSAEQPSFSEQYWQPDYMKLAWALIAGHGTIPFPRCSVGGQPQVKAQFFVVMAGVIPVFTIAALGVSYFNHMGFPPFG